MNQPLNRRDFLKLAGLLSASYALPQFIAPTNALPQNANVQNVLIVVFDAFSAHNMSLYGYPRKTTPNIERLAEKAIVYHNHFSGGNFTTPGTASLLTGTLPWTHRAMGFPAKTVTQTFATKSLFHTFPNYHRMAYSHNPLANSVLKAFFREIEDYVPREQLFLEKNQLINSFFKKDEDIASVSAVRALKPQEDHSNYSLFFARIYEALRTRKYVDLLQHFPRGLPNINTDDYFLLENGIDWLRDQVATVPQPFLSYYHFLPPHNPYATRDDFFGTFQGDGYRPPEKPKHLFNRGVGTARLLEQRQWYDEFILYVDAEFARLYQGLESAGILENTWLVLTSDHGELFERGVRGHSTYLLHQPVIHIPLLIFPPGQQTRQDITEKTSALDVLPTLAHLTGQERPAWGEGTLLPPFGPSAPDRPIFVLESEKTPENAPITQGTVALVQGNYKLMYFFGYNELDGSELLELYDLENDPEELNNLYSTQKSIGDEMLSTVKEQLQEKNLPYLEQIETHP
ncbi:MAG: sulfatase-like hydrolase/transferase [Anaerolineales bacterium]|nr:sulfatase-like hydrolase/transferase [Anaerolineales bacterium]